MPESARETQKRQETPGSARKGQTAKQKNIKVIIAGMIAPTTHGETYKNNFDTIYPNLAKKYNLPLIPFLLDGIALNPKLNQQDGIHPNKDGTMVMSKTLQKSIKYKF